MTNMISVSLSQYRLLGRLVRGVHMPVARYRSEHATIAALLRKGLVHRAGKAWGITERGRRIHACRGKLRPDSQIWDGATSEERSAYRRVMYNGPDAVSGVERDMAARLHDRITGAGERVP